jgi:transcriptional regulator with XRE-family HTH domain
MELNERIRLARTRADLTQQQVADHFGIKRPTVSQWEIGTHRPDQDKFPELAAVLGVTLDWLMSEEGSGPPAKKTDQTTAPKPSKFLKSSRYRFYVKEWRQFMVGDKVDTAARAAGMPENEYLAFEAYPINFTLGQIAALADELGIRGDQFWWKPPEGRSASRPVKSGKKQARAR